MARQTRAPQAPNPAAIATTSAVKVVLGGSVTLSHCNAFLPLCTQSWTPIPAQRSGSSSVSGSSTESSSTLTFPLPHLGGEFSYKFSPRWSAQFTLLAFALEVNEYSGSLLEVDGTVAYQLSKHFGIGAGLKYFNLNLQAQKSGGGAEFDYQFFGPAVFGVATF